jgi:hypothetical protein
VGGWPLGKRGLAGEADDRYARWTRRAMTEDTHHLATYVVRVSRDASSRIRGVVVHVATGERSAFDSVDGMALLIRERVELDAAGHT